MSGLISAGHIAMMTRSSSESDGWILEAIFNRSKIRLDCM